MRERSRATQRSLVPGLALVCAVATLLAVLVDLRATPPDPSSAVSADTDVRMVPVVDPSSLLGGWSLSAAAPLPEGVAPCPRYHLSSETFYGSGGFGGPRLSRVDFSMYSQWPGDDEIVRVYAAHAVPVVRVTVTPYASGWLMPPLPLRFHSLGSLPFPMYDLTLVEGLATDGVWQGEWTAGDCAEAWHIMAEASDGTVSSIVITAF